MFLDKKLKLPAQLKRALSPACISCRPNSWSGNSLPFQQQLKLPAQLKRAPSPACISCRPNLWSSNSLPFQQQLKPAAARLQYFYVTLRIKKSRIRQSPRINKR
jgi:hypothetical protein